jgi:hypothetical protein
LRALIEDVREDQRQVRREAEIQVARLGAGRTTATVDQIARRSRRVLSR